MQKTIIAFLVILLALSIQSNTAYALKQYRCNGRVQYRPCDMPPQGNKKIKKKSAKISKKDVPLYQPGEDVEGPRFSSVIEQKLANAPKTKWTKMPEGIWSGVVEGNGFVRLFLEVSRNGAMEDRRFMGGIVLHNKSTIFKYVSVLPKGSDWSWKVVSEVL